MRRQRLPIDFSVWPIASSAVGSTTIPLGNTPEGWDFRNPSQGGAVAIEPSPQITWPSGSAGQSPRLTVPDIQEYLTNPSLPTIRGIVGAIPTIIRCTVQFGNVPQTRGTVRLWLAATRDFQNGVFLQIRREYESPLVERLPPYGSLNSPNSGNPAELVFEDAARAAFGLELNSFPQFAPGSGVINGLRWRYTIGSVVSGQLELGQSFDTYYGNETSVRVEFGLNPFNLVPDSQQQIVYALIQRSGTQRTETPLPTTSSIPTENREVCRPGLSSTTTLPFDPFSDRVGDTRPMDWLEPFFQESHITAFAPSNAVGTEENPLATRTTIVEIVPTTTNLTAASLPSIANAGFFLRNAVTGRFSPHVPHAIEDNADLTPVCVSPRASYAVGGFGNFVPDFADLSPYATKDGPSWHAQGLAPIGTAGAINGSLSSLVVRFPELYVPFVWMGKLTIEEAALDVNGRVFAQPVGQIDWPQTVFSFANPGPGVEAVGYESPFIEPHGIGANAIFRNAVAGQDFLMQPFIKGARLLPGHFSGIHFLQGGTVSFSSPKQERVFGEQNSADITVGLLPNASVSYEIVAQSFAMAYRRCPMSTVNLANEEAWSEYEKVAELGVALDSFDYWTRRPARYVEPADVRIVMDLRLQIRGTGVGVTGGQVLTPIVVHPARTMCREIYRRIGIRVASENVVALANGQPVQAEMMARGFGENRFNPILISDPNTPFIHNGTPPNPAQVVGTWDVVSDFPYNFFDFGLGIYPVQVIVESPPPPA